MVPRGSMGLYLWRLSRDPSVKRANRHPSMAVIAIFACMREDPVQWNYGGRRPLEICFTSDVE